MGVDQQPGGQSAQVGDLGLQFVRRAGVHGQIEGHPEQAGLADCHPGGEFGGITGGRGLVRILGAAVLGVQPPGRLQARPAPPQPGGGHRRGHRGDVQGGIHAPG